MNELRLFADQAGLHEATPWALLDESRRVVRQGFGLLDLPAADELLVIIPDQCVTLLSLPLPRLSLRQVKAALPAAAEDQLLMAVEDCDLVLLHHSQDGISKVAAWSLEWRDALLRELATLKAPVVRIVAESWGLPLPADDMTLGLLLDDRRCVLRRADGRTFVDEHHGGMPSVIGLALRETDAPLQVFLGAGTATEIPGWVHELLVNRGQPGNRETRQNRGQTPISRKSKSGSVPGFTGLLFDWRTANFPLQPCLYQRRRLQLDTEAAARALRLTALLAGAWLVLELLALTVDWGVLRYQRGKLKGQQEQVFHEVFGPAATLVDAELQIRRKLDAIRAAAGEATAADFLVLLTRLEKEFPDAAPLTEIRYHGDQLGLRTSDAQAGQKWHKVALAAGFSATIDENGTLVGIKP